MALPFSGSGDVETRVAQARALFEEMALVIREAGFQTRLWNDSELPLFRMLTAAQQVDVITDLVNRLELFQSARRDGVSLLDTRQLLWRSLRLCAWVPQSDVFDSIDEEDTVEVYSLDQRQTFRNLQFFKWVSFTLEQIHSRPWYELTTRNQAVESALHAEAGKILSGAVKTTLSLHAIPEHLVTEIGTEELRSFYLRMRCFSPVWQDGRLSGVIAVNRTRPARGVSA